MNRRILAAFFAGFLLAGCSQKTESIIIASKSFTEQEILGEILAQLIEEKTKIPVVRKFYLGGTQVCFNALRQGDVDLYVEYSGTALMSILNQPVLTDAARVLKIVQEEFHNRYGLLWLEPLGFNNAYTLTMRREHAQKLGIAKISQLARFQDQLTAGFDHEFMDRQDGYPGLVKRYGIKFAKPPAEMDPGLMVSAIVNKKVDVICGFATDGRIPANNLTILEDDLHFFPPYHASVVARKDTLERYPQLEPILKLLAGQISDEEMRTLNFSVDQEKKFVKIVVQEFLKSKRLLASE